MKFFIFFIFLFFFHVFCHFIALYLLFIFNKESLFDSYGIYIERFFEQYEKDN